jgi:hypothetical protein
MTDTVVDQVTTQGVATPLLDTRGRVPAHIPGQDHARGPRHRSPASLASRPGTSEDIANENS